MSLLTVTFKERQKFLRKLEELLRIVTILLSYILVEKASDSLQEEIQKSSKFTRRLNVRKSESLKAGMREHRKQIDNKRNTGN